MSQLGPNCSRNPRPGRWPNRSTPATAYASACGVRAESTGVYRIEDVAREERRSQGAGDLGVVESLTNESEGDEPPTVATQHACDGATGTRPLETRTARCSKNPELPGLLYVRSG